MGFGVAFPLGFGAAFPFPFSFVLPDGAHQSHWTNSTSCSGLSLLPLWPSSSLSFEWDWEHLLHQNVEIQYVCFLESLMGWVLHEEREVQGYDEERDVGGYFT